VGALNARLVRQGFLRQPALGAQPAPGRRRKKGSGARKEAKKEEVMTDNDIIGIGVIAVMAVFMALVWTCDFPICRRLRARFSDVADAERRNLSGK
jgi:hypothetical protein